MFMFLDEAIFKHLSVNTFKVIYRIDSRVQGWASETNFTHFIFFPKKFNAKCNSDPGSNTRPSPHVILKKLLRLPIS